MISRAIVLDGEVAGTIGSWGDPGEREVTYWIGRSYWGEGIATCALDAFLTVDRSRPLHPRVAARLMARKSVFSWLPSQKGLVAERPQRQRAMVSLCS